MAGFCRDREKHCIARDSLHDWSGDGDRHAWYVSRVKRFRDPVPVGMKGQTGSCRKTFHVSVMPVAGK